MATAEEGGATANTTSSSYGGGGAGGKFRKKLFRRQPTPYDRPPTGLRGNNNSTSSWLTKLVVDPASKLISYGADRFYASVFRKRLPPPPPPQPPEENADMSDGVQAAVPNRQGCAQDPTDGDHSQPINISSSNGISELEQLLKQKTFTRSEIVHLTELLQSKAAEVPLRDDGEKNKQTASESGRHQQFASGSLEENRNGENRSSAVMSTPILNSKVLEDDLASPAELAKAYMGTRPLKVSPSVLGMRSQVGREDAGLRSNMPFVSKSPVMSSTKQTSVSLGAPENGFITPRSRGRSAIYNMARTPYSRVHPTSILKGSVLNSSGHAGSSMLPSSLSLSVKDEKFASQPMTLKRRSSVLDDEVGSVGPIRRIRQKPNLLAPRIHHGVGIGSHAKQNLQLIGEPSHKASKAVGETENDSVPSTSYARVPSKSTQVAARILQHLEKLTPKEKSSESKLGAVREKSHLKLTPSMLSGQALRSMEDMDSSKLLLDVQDDHKLENRTNATQPDARDSSSQKQGKVEENGPKESSLPSDTWNPIKSNDSAVSWKTSSPGTEATDSVVKNVASLFPQRKRAFRMSAQEDSLEQDDDVHCNGLATRPFSEIKGPTETILTDSKLALAGEPKLEKPRIQSEDKSPSSLVLRNTSELSSPGGNATTIGEESSAIVFPASEETTAASISAVLPLSVSPFDKPKESNNPPPLFSFSSKVADKFPSLPSESSEKAESKPESSSSFLNVSTATGSLVKVPGSDNSFRVNIQRPGDAASTGLPVLSSPPVSLTAASSSDTKQPSTGGALLFSSTSSVQTATSTSAATTGSIFGLATKHSSSTAPILKFGAAVDPSSAASAASTSNISEVADLRTKAEGDPSSGSSSSSFSTVSAFAAANSGSSTLGLGSSVSTENNLQGFLFAGASKSLVPGAATVSQGTSVQSVSSALLPSFTANGSTSFSSSLSNPQMFNPNNTFGFSSSASSSDTSVVITAGVSTPSVVKFGVSSAAVSEATAVSSSSGATPGIFSFGYSSSSSSTNAVGSSSGATLPIFSSSGSLVSTSVINTASSFNSGTSGAFNFGGNSSAASSSSTSSNAAPSGNALGSNWQSPKSPIFGSSTTGFSFGASSTASAATNASPSTGFSFGALSTTSTAANASPSTGFSFGASSASTATTNASPFSFGASSTSSAPTNASPFSFGAVSTSSAPTNAPPSTGFSFGASSAPTNTSPSTGFSFGASTNTSQSAGFSFGASSTSSAPTNAALPMVFNSSSSSRFSVTAASASVFSSPSSPMTQPVFGSAGFAASPGNNDQMNAEDSMAEDPVQSSAPSMPVFGQPSVTPSPPGFAFGSTVPSPGPSPFMFSGQQNQAAPQNPSPFPASGSLGGSFSLGSGAGDKSGRKIVKINRNKNRKK